jgi:hypothetical protein
LKLKEMETDGVTGKRALDEEIKDDLATEPLSKRPRSDVTAT